MANKGIGHELESRRLGEILIDVKPLIVHEAIPQLCVMLMTYQKRGLSSQFKLQTLGCNYVLYQSVNLSIHRVRCAPCLSTKWAIVERNRGNPLVLRGWCCGFRLGCHSEHQLPSYEALPVRHYRADVFPCFPDVWNPARKERRALWSCVVSSQRKINPAKAIDLLTEVTCASPQVGDRVDRIGKAKARSRRWHDLQHALGAGRAYCKPIVP